MDLSGSSRPQGAWGEGTAGPLSSLLTPRYNRRSLSPIPSPTV